MDIQQIFEYNQPYNEKNLNALIEKIKSNSIVPYIGAGMSMLFEGVYPLWSQFLENTFCEFCSTSDRTEFDRKNFEEKADFLCSEIGDISFANHLKSIFDSTHLDREVKDFESKAICMLPQIFDKGLILTTNYDKVIETIYSFYHKTITSSHPGHFEALNRALRDNDLLLFKFHGDISEPTSSIILTKEQYDKAYSNSTLIESLKQSYLSKSMLFLGCSLYSDRSLDVLKDVCSDGISHFAIISCTESGIKERRISLEKEYYTQAIIYPDGKHECVKILLEYIVNAINPQPLSVQEKIFTLKTDNQLTEEWFIKQNEIQIKNLGNRYSPDLNVGVQISNVFDALSRNKNFADKFSSKTSELLIALQKLKIKDIDIIIDEISELGNCFTDNISTKLPNAELLDITNKILDKIEEKIIRTNEEKSEINRKIQFLHIDSKNHDKSIRKYNQQLCILQDFLYNLHSTYVAVENYISYLNSSEIKVVNNPYIMLYGEGGIGKSHLLADIIIKRREDGQKSLLFLGQHFAENIDPLISMTKMLELKCTSETFLNTLNQIGENDKTKIIIFVDALNEGNGKNIWKNHLHGIMEKLKEYHWIGLVVSIRSEYLELLYSDNHELKNELINVQHNGFSTVEYKAIKVFFDFYNINYMEIPFIQQEFRNPLFLKLLCEGYRDKRIDLSVINILDVYKNYLLKINMQIAEKRGHNQRLNIVQKALDKMVLCRYQNNERSNLIDINTVLDLIIQVEKENNVNADLLGELLSSGILTQSLNYNNQEFLHITYEKLDDYSYSKLLIKELKEIGVQNFQQKYVDLRYYPDLLEMLAVTLSEETEFELFEVFDNTDTIAQSFCNALKWRKTETITDKTFKYINEIVFKTSRCRKLFYESLILLSTKSDHQLNAYSTVQIIMKGSMPYRDSYFIPLFDELSYDETSPLNRLIDWSLTRDIGVPISDETIRLATLMLSVLLISPNRELRDKATKGIINLLSGKIDLVISLLEYHKNTDDPYIIERLYAIAFGYVVSENNNNNIKKLAICVYDNIFSTRTVYLNILLRDYAKSIIEYAKYKFPCEEIMQMNIEPPYNTNMPEIPSDEEISKYKLDYDSGDFKDYWWSQNLILSSMEVEYNRNGHSGGYGDFGRYIFQSYFSNWDGLDYNDLKNIAIKRVFDMGYDVEKHGQYDRTISGGRSRSTKTERIGKKYQWIAFHELAAQVSDNFKMKIDRFDSSNNETQYCIGSAEPNVRDIDPTISTNSYQNNMTNIIQSKLYSLPSQTVSDWLSNMDDLPKSKNMIKLKYSEQDFILLNGRYSWGEDEKTGIIKYKNPTKNAWVLINSYIIKENQLEDAIKFLRNKNFMGRWLNEPSQLYNIYNKEYYWSQTYDFFKDIYEQGEAWESLHKYTTVDRTDLKVLLPTYRYVSERESDALFTYNDYSWYKPCDELFNALNMQYDKENSTLYDNDKNIICFDSSELLNESIGFFINEKLFRGFLEANNYRVIWTLLSEKLIIYENPVTSDIRPTTSAICIFTNEDITEISKKLFKD